ncbi:PREDICTED: uncharacterized protein LOC109210729 [Nicotiana attenuata]|uniref:uncharacterized protein LOC109210729 n=1 Tax=Nicotiana attenuata TaxID=49451 RepID=UPI0009058DFA|nr:PREDICTED: uncharacterized protein LOC109210729 [Nicotiana attenuata]
MNSLYGNSTIDEEDEQEIDLDETQSDDDTPTSPVAEGNKASSQDKVKALIFLCHHLDEGLKVEYLTMKDPFELWTVLKERYDHLKATVLPKARYEWMHLRLQEFKTQQYRERGFKKYFELISWLLVAEQHNTLLVKYHEARPTGSALIREANMIARRDKSGKR